MSLSYGGVDVLGGRTGRSGFVFDRICESRDYIPRGIEIPLRRALWWRMGYRLQFFRKYLNKRLDYHKLYATMG